VPNRYVNLLRRTSIFVSVPLLMAPLPAQEADVPAAPPAKAAELKWPTAEDLFKQARAAEADEPQQSIRLLQQGLRLQPNAVTARRELIRLYETQDNLAAAVVQARRCLELEPTVEAVRDVVRLLATLRDELGAAIAAENGAEAFPDSTELQSLAGERLLAADAPERAIAYLERCAERAPAGATVGVLLGQAYERTGRTNAALGAYRRALASDAQHVAGREGMARLRARAVPVGDCLLLPPEGWVYSAGSLWHPDPGRNVAIGLAPEGAPADTAKRLALGTVPDAFTHDGPGGFIDRAVTKLVEDAAKTGKIVSRKEAEALLRVEELPRYALETRSVGEPYPGVLVQVRLMPGAGDGASALPDATPRLALVVAPAKQPLSLVMGCDGAASGSCGDVLLELAACIVPAPEGRAER